MTQRRHVLAGLAALGGGILLPRMAQAKRSIDAVEFGLVPGSASDQSARFNELLAQASAGGEQIFLPPGTYVVSGLALPAYVNLVGVAGRSRLQFGGAGGLITASGASQVQLSGLVIDGDDRPLGKDVRGLVEAANVGRLVLEDCDIVGARVTAVDLFQCGGRIENNRISGTKDVGIFAANSTGLQIAGNEISDCGNGGIIVHRYDKGKDGTIVSGNRVSKIRADAKGTGQYGNGINVYQAHNVVIAGNVVSDCAFSAIRANTADSVQIIGNNCTGSGETAIYSEFAFEGAVVSNNLVDGGTNGISLANFNEGGRMGVCSDNIVRNLSTKGPYVPGPTTPANFGVGIGVEADTSVTGNVIENAPLYGIQIGWGPYMRNVIASGNIIRNAEKGIYVSVVDGIGTAIVSGNIVEGSKTGGIVGGAWDSITVADLQKSASSYASLTIEGNRIR
ncbi:MAG: TIGR03808 family TAT-translocated repetitive protein [Alphaproteobacteria bacterium]